MTDPYGSEPHDHEEHKEDAGAEAWHDDRPPVDDFADHPEEEALASEETAPEADQEIQTEEKKKRSMVLPVVVGAIGVVFLGAMLYIQFGGSASSNAPTASAMTGPTAPKPTEGSAGQTASASGDVDINSLYNESHEQGQAKLPDAAPTTSSVAMSGSGDIPSIQPSVPTTAETGQPSVPPIPAIAPSQQAATAPANLVPALQPPLPMPMASGSTSNVDARLGALTARIDGLQKSLDQATQQLAQVSNMVAANPAPAQPSPALADQLGRMEQQLVQLEHNVTVQSPAPQASPPEIETSPAMKAKTTSYAIHKTKHKTVKHKSIKMASYKSSKHRTRKTGSVVSGNKHWVLRAATPDTAWVSTSANSPQLRRVGIGDVLPGIGRVRAIHQAGDGWVVEGSAGTIR